MMLIKQNDVELLLPLSYFEFEACVVLLHFMWLTDLRADTNMNVICSSKKDKALKIQFRSDPSANITGSALEQKPNHSRTVSSIYSEFSVITKNNVPILFSSLIIHLCMYLHHKLS